MKLIIVCAACQYEEGSIVLGARHFDDRMREQIGRTALDWTMAEQGFIDQFGNSHDRKGAMEIVKRNLQSFNIKRNGGDEFLFSEGLY